MEKYRRIDDHPGIKKLQNKTSNVHQAKRFVLHKSSVSIPQRSRRMKRKSDNPGLEHEEQHNYQGKDRRYNKQRSVSQSVDEESRQKRSNHKPRISRRQIPSTDPAEILSFS